jgi:hypothetical protein
MIRRGRRDLSQSGEGLGRVGEVMCERETDLFNCLLVDGGRKRPITSHRIESPRSRRAR